MNIKLFGKDYMTKLPFEILFGRMQIKRIKADKHTIYCYFGNIKDTLILDNKIKLPNEIQKDLDTIFNSNKEITIKIQKHYLSDSIDFDLSIDVGEIELWYNDEFFTYGCLPAMLIIKVNKWLKENEYNITFREIVKD